MILASRQFSLDDQKAFALLSGDANPMHMDAIFSRRTQAGAPVVHGIHLLLWALECFAGANSELPFLKLLRSRFKKFVYVDEAVTLSMSASGAVRKLKILSGGQVASDITLTFGDIDIAQPILLDFPAPALAPPIRPFDRPLEQLSDWSGRLDFQSGLKVSSMFPSASLWIGRRRVTALAASSNLVGMVCPGLHSVYTGLALETYQETHEKDALAFQVVIADSDFRHVRLNVAGGGFAGNLETFARKPPVQQLSMLEIGEVVTSREFSGSIALIIGGSRGLGELTAKLIAAGGAHVIITYFRGRDDALRVAEEICSAGGSCEILALDVKEAIESQLAAIPTPSHVYYFATPVIFAAHSEVFSPNRFHAFLEIYVDGFWRLINALRRANPALSVFYPSSVAVADRPKGMTEYAMAKAAGEALCTDMNLVWNPLTITVSRLPRLATDQTASLVHIETPPAIDVILPIVRDIQSQIRGKP